MSKLVFKPEDFSKDSYSIPSDYAAKLAQQTEEIKKCEHENVLLEHKYSSPYTLTILKCKDCNKQLKPKNGWEEI